MTRKRKFLTGSLAVLAIVAVVIPLQHPYVWQSLFGPRIHGYPLWQWQQDYLREIRQEEPDDYLKLVRDFLGMKRPEPFLLKQGVSQPEAVMILAGLVNDPDETVRRSVAYHLGDIYLEGLEAIIIGRRRRVLAVHRAPLVEEDNDARRAASAALIQLLDDPSSEVQTTAVRSLGWIGPCATEAEPRLRQIIDESDTTMRLDAAEALWHITGDWQTASQVARDALAADANDRGHAVRLLSHIGRDDDRVYSELISLYESSPHADIRWIALWELGHAGHEDVIPLLLKSLKSGQVAEQGLAAQCLSLFGAKAQAAVPALERAARSSDANLRRHAIDALSRIDPKRYPDRGGP